MTTDYRVLEEQLSASLRLKRRPVAITVRDLPPPGVPRFVGTAPSGCTFWRLAANGHAFYTVPADHYNCPIGAYTHNIPLPAGRAHELEDTLGLMAGIGYIRMEEVPGIARLPHTPGVIVYAPLGETPVDPDVVLFSGPASTIMLLQETAIRAGINGQLSASARPTCMAVPAALASGMIASSACVGNRVYTGLDDAELYIAIRGKELLLLANHVQSIAAANAKLFDYHKVRRQQLATD